MFIEEGEEPVQVIANVQRPELVQPAEPVQEMEEEDVDMGGLFGDFDEY